MKAIPRSVWGFALVVMVVTSLPYLIAAVSTPPDARYTGAAAIPTGVAVDYHSHLAKMWHGRRGDLTYQLLFSSEPHAGLPIVQGFYIALGALSPFDLALTYHIARAALTFLLIIALWCFAARFFEKPGERWLCLVFATLVCGVSYLLLVIDPTQAAQVAPIELWLIDAYNLMGALFMPHFAAGMCLQIAAALAFMDRRPVSLTLALAALSIVQPFSIVLTMPLFGLLALRDWFDARARMGYYNLRHVTWLIVPFSVHTALTLFQFAATQSDAVWRSFTAQNITLSPPPIYYLLGYAPFLIPIALAFMRRKLRLSRVQWWLPVLWVIIVAVLVYAPLPTQRRYLIGVQTPLAALAALSWVQLTRTLSLRRRVMVTSAYIGVTALPLALMIIANIASRSNIMFIDHDTNQAFAWLRRETSSDDVILTTFDDTGNGSGGLVVAQTGHRVFIGHWIETADFQHKTALVRQFYDASQPDTWRCEFVRMWNIVYVWYDDHARAQGDYSPALSPLFEDAYTTDAVTVFRALPERCTIP